MNQLRDRELKLELYSRQGVHEYWIVDSQAHLVEIYRRETVIASPAPSTGEASGVVSSPPP